MFCFDRETTAFEGTAKGSQAGEVDGVTSACEAGGAVVAACGTAATAATHRAVGADH